MTKIEGEDDFQVLKDWLLSLGVSPEELEVPLQVELTGRRHPNREVQALARRSSLQAYNNAVRARTAAVLDTFPRLYGPVYSAEEPAPREGVPPLELPGELLEVIFRGLSTRDAREYREAFDRAKGGDRGPICAIERRGWETERRFRAVGVTIPAIRHAAEGLVAYFTHYPEWTMHEGWRAWVTNRIFWAARYFIRQASAEQLFTRTPFRVTLEEELSWVLCQTIQRHLAVPITTEESA